VQLDPSGADLDGGEIFGQVFFGDGTFDYIDVMLPYVWRTVKHVYADNGTYALTLIVTDARGGRDTATTTVAIANVAPTILPGSLTGPSGPTQLIDGSASVPISFEFSDPAARSDVYSAEVGCGNGVVLGATTVPVAEFTGSGAYAGTCTYTNAGVYTVRATVSDEDGGTSAPAFYRYVVVFDPEGASATGGGFYSVPGQGKTKAHFSFDVGYAEGQMVPNGTARFWTQGRQLEFESSTIEMLVASTNRAQFWGIGTLNGAPARFRITAASGGGAPDAIRVELWDESGTTVLFDTQPGAAQDAPVTTVIDGGNIKIHQ
jgi:hypothetical protein